MGTKGFIKVASLTICDSLWGRLKMPKKVHVNFKQLNRLLPINAGPLSHEKLFGLSKNGLRIRPILKSQRKFNPKIKMAIYIDDCKSDVKSQSAYIGS